MTPKPDAALLRRAAAARELVSLGELAPEDALFVVVCPPVELEHVGPRNGPVDDERRARAVALVAGGASWQQAADAVGAAKASVGSWVRTARSEAAISTHEHERGSVAA